MSSQALPFVVLLGLFFGSTLTVSRFGVSQFHPLTYVGLRLVLASAGFVAVYLVHRPGMAGRRWPHGRTLWRDGILLGVLGTAVPMSTVVASLEYQSSGVTAMLLTANPALTVVLAHFWLTDERLSPKKVAGVLLALAGALVLTLRGETGLPDVSAASPIGYGLVGVSMLFGSAMTVYARRNMRELDSVDVSSVRMWAAALVVMPLAILAGGLDFSLVDGLGYGALVYAALGTFGGLLLAFYNIKRFGATAAAMAAYVIPVVTAVLGVLLLNEHITSGMALGMALILAGIALINRG